MEGQLQVPGGYIYVATHVLLHVPTVQALGWVMNNEWHCPACKHGRGFFH